MSIETHQFTLAYGQIKKDVIALGILGEPEPDGIGFGFNAVDTTRQVEINDLLDTLRDAVLESVDQITSGSGFSLFIPIDANRDEILVTLPSLLTLPAGYCGFAVSDGMATRLTDTTGTTSFVTLVEQLGRYMRDDYLKQR